MKKRFPLQEVKFQTPTAHLIDVIKNWINRGLTLGPESGFKSYKMVANYHLINNALINLEERRSLGDGTLACCGWLLVVVLNDFEKKTHAVRPLVDEDHPEHQVLRQLF